MVTGASSGIGAATARLLAGPGNYLWLTYATDAVGANRTAADCRRSGAQVEVSRLDLRSPTDLSALWDEVRGMWGELHALVNNGGVCPYRRYDEIELDEWDAVMETNARGAFLMIRESLPLLRAAEGDRAIVNISSVAGQLGGIQTGVHYAASKAAILAITRSFARLLAHEQIRVNAVCPGPISTPITDQLDESGRASQSASSPLGRMGAPEEVAPTIALLAGAESGYTTGATYDVNGGIRID